VSSCVGSRGAELEAITSGPDAPRPATGRPATRSGSMYAAGGSGRGDLSASPYVPMSRASRHSWESP
jgi:hypothetical protein